MAVHLSLAVLFLLFLQLSCDTQFNPPHKRFEYKYSLKGPYIVQKDGTVPFWEFGGSTIASDEQVRITPSLRSKKGQLWTKNPLQFDNWEVEIVLRIMGPGRIGADGMAFWYTRVKGVEGPVFGSNDKWDGLGIFFDSFDNDNRHNNPYIAVMVNDGSKSFDHQTDGLNQQMGGCLRDFRNKPFPVRARIEYYKNTLTLFVHNGLSNSREDYEMCMRAENVFLPRNGHFGISAATGGLADDHDLLAFLTTSLTPPDQPLPTQSPISEEEKKKFADEYDQYSDKLEKQKQEYQKEHPDQIRKEEGKPEDFFEYQQERELRQIFDGQNRILITTQELHRKLDEVIGRQERTLAAISAISGGIAPQTGHQGGAAQPILVDSIKRHEVDALMNHQRDVSQTVRDIRSFVVDIQQKTNALSQGGVKPVGGQAFDNQMFVHEIKDSLNNMKTNVDKILTKQSSSGSVHCPPSVDVNCVTPIYFFFFMSLQLVAFIGYLIYRGNKEASAKKFY